MLWYYQGLHCVDSELEHLLERKVGIFCVQKQSTGLLIEALQTTRQSLI